MFMYCRQCPFSIFSPSLTGGTDHRHCQLDPCVLSADDRPDECRADLDILKGHQHASLFFDTIRVRSERLAEANRAKAENDRVFGLIKSTLEGLISENPGITPDLIRQAIKEIAADRVRHISMRLGCTFCGKDTLEADPLYQDRETGVCLTCRERSDTRKGPTFDQSAGT